MQRHKILINLGYSAQTANNNSSNLTSFGDYQVTNVQGLGGGIVNSSNVRGFLNDDANEIIINDFFSYLTASTTTIEFAEIYNSDQKLSDVFNDYYVSSVLSNQQPATAVIDGSLSGTSGVTIIQNEIYNYDGFAEQRTLQNIPNSIVDSSRALAVYSALTTYTLEQSYYIPVFITRTSKQMARLNFDSCDERINTSLNTGNFVFRDASRLFTPDIQALPEERFVFINIDLGVDSTNTSVQTTTQEPITTGTTPVTTGTTTDTTVTPVETTPTTTDGTTTQPTGTTVVVLTTEPLITGTTRPTTFIPIEKPITKTEISNPPTRLNVGNFSIRL